MNTSATNNKCTYKYKYGPYRQSDQDLEKCSLPAVDGDPCFFHRQQSQPKTTDEYNAWREQVGQPQKSCWFAPEAQLRQAKLQRARLEHAILTRADIREANLTGAFLHGTTLNLVEYGQGFDRETVFSEIDLSNINWSHNPLLKRWIEDYQYLEQFRRLHPIWYWLWLKTSDCGRSWLRWLVVVVFVVVLFGFLYAPWSPLNAFFWNPKIKMPDDGSCFAPFYFSVVTFSTLGFGDMHPLNAAGQVSVVIEVVLGYILFGILLTLVATKIARRA